MNRISSNNINDIVSRIISIPEEELRKNIIAVFEKLDTSAEAESDTDDDIAEKMNRHINKLNNIVYTISADTNQWSTNNTKPILYQSVLLSKDIFDIFMKTDNISAEKKQQIFTLFYYLLYAIENQSDTRAIENLQKQIKEYPSYANTMTDIYLQVSRFMFEPSAGSDDYNELSDKDFFLKNVIGSASQL
jgi:hypothetical protein